MTAVNQILEALVAQLITDDVASGQIYNSRLYKVPDENLPAVFVSVLSDTVDYAQSTFIGSVLKQMRQLDIEIIVKATASDGAALVSSLSTISSAIEYSIYANKKLGLGIMDFRYLSTSFDFNEDSSAPRGFATLSFTLLYQILEPASDVIV